MTLRSSCFAAFALVASSFVVGCAAEAPAEAQGETTSHVTAGSSESAALDRIADRVNGCYKLTDEERGTLWRLTPGFKFNADIYVYFSCSVSAGEVVKVSATVERRAGWSSTDGVFGETSMSASTSLNIPVKVITANGNITHEETVRTSGGVTVTGSSDSVGVGVERHFVLAKASVSADVTADSVSVTGGVASPIEIPLAACGGADGSFGARIALSATRDESVPAAISNRASDLIAQDADNRWVIQQATGTDQNTSSEHRHSCCLAQSTCD